MDDLAVLLVRASKAMGSLLEVARLLEVEPYSVYRWIAGVDCPPAERIASLTERLQAALSQQPK
jgi:DNA-binding transcriptional regulator YdaS (Cro superfamily)